jgi:hypothetical protein
MQEKAGEVTHPRTSHNQKQQQEPSKRQTQKAANRSQEVVCTEPKTTTNKQKTTLQPNSQPAQKPTEGIYPHKHFSRYLKGRGQQFRVQQFFNQKEPISGKHESPCQ